MELRGRFPSPDGSSQLVSGRLRVAEGRLEAVQTASVPAAAPLILPGFVDVHVHGGGGADTMDGPAAVEAVARFHLAHGTTALAPTTVCAPVSQLTTLLAGIAQLPPASSGRARLLGVHLEGPFLNPAKLGAQPGHALEPDPALLEQLLTAGPVAVLTLAPELPGALALIERAATAGVHVSLGHSLCSLAEAQAAFAAGARGVTHLFNAMSGIHHRQPGLAAAALEDPGVTCELILDGHHVAPALLGLVRRALRGRLALVSDAIRAAGQPDGPSELGGQAVTVQHGCARLADGTLAGSVLTLDQALRNAVDQGFSPAEASRWLSLHPAQALGRRDLGRIEVGARADLVVLDPDSLEVREVVLAGSRAATAPEHRGT